MRDGHIIGQFQQVWKALAVIEQAMKMAVTGESVRNQALVDLLQKKGIITEIEMTHAVGEVIQKINQPKKEVPKKEESKEKTKNDKTDEHTVATPGLIGTEKKVEKQDSGKPELKPGEKVQPKQDEKPSKT